MDLKILEVLDYSFNEIFMIIIIICAVFCIVTFGFSWFAKVVTRSTIYNIIRSKIRMWFRGW